MPAQRLAFCLIGTLILNFMGALAQADTLRVPADFATIQDAIDDASPGDTVLVAAGTYRERVRLRAGVTLKSEGDDRPGEVGLLRAEATTIHGNFDGATGPGVAMAEGATLDGFTITGVGDYDDALWQQHYATFGEEQPHEHIGAPGTAGIAVDGVEQCTVTNNIVHRIGYTGIAIVGAEGKRVSPHIVANVAFRNMGAGIGSMKGSTAIIDSNKCFENFYAGIGHSHASPSVTRNVCYGNVRAGIGISEGSCPLVRDNRCYQNRRAGIGIRTGSNTQPIVEHNDCFENEMAGIGNRDEARPIIRHNRCYKNRMAGIGCRDESRALIEHNECFENEMSGIGSRRGAAPVIRNNRCYRNQMAGIGSREQASPVIEDNDCFENAMAGIGCQTGASPIIRNNRCYRNEMAGIASRLGARPVISENECYENKLAGIGSREGATPLIYNNRSHHNQQAGIGVRDGARPVIVDNDSRENQAAGIGIRGKQTAAVVVGNRCIENRLVAIGLPDGATGYIHGNELLRTEGGAPPLLAVKGGSIGFISHNSIRGGGVAGVLVQGNAHIFGNRFQGKGHGQGSAIWVWKDSQVNIDNNLVRGYRNALNASGSRVAAIDNVTLDFSGPSIIVKQPSQATFVLGNLAVSDRDGDSAVEAAERSSHQDANTLITPHQFEEANVAPPLNWPSLSDDRDGLALHPLHGTGQQLTVRDGPWKLVVTYGEETTYALFHVEDDPAEDRDLSGALEQIVYRLRGLIEKTEGLQHRSDLPGDPSGD